MVTVKQLKEVGFIFDFGDKISNEKFNLIIDCGSVLDAWNENSCIDCKSFVYEVNWRINKGTQPVDDNLWVEVLYADGEKDLALASEFCWGNEDNLTHWKPSLKHLEQQMNDTQETKTALEMSERDICDEIDLDISGQLDKLLEGNKAKDKLNELGYEFHQGEWLSKEEIEKQKAARERMESAYDLYVSCGVQRETISFDRFKKDPIEVWLAIVDKTGYRKQ